VLLKLKERQDENRKLFGKEYQKSDYIFKYADGTLFRPDSATRSFQRVLKNHGLAQMRFHDLRHSTASIMYEMGCDVKEIQYWLGHADIETTL
jgi:integrase